MALKYVSRGTARFLMVGGFVTLVLSGCFATRTHTLTPGAEGVVVALSNGAPVKGAAVSETSSNYPPSYQPKTTLTPENGYFAFPAITAGEVVQLMAPGAGVPVSRTFTFKKEGFVTRACRVTDMSLFSEPRTLKVGLLEGVDIAKNSSGELQFMSVDGGVECTFSEGDAIDNSQVQPRLLSVQVILSGNPPGH